MIGLLMYLFPVLFISNGRFFVISGGHIDFSYVVVIIN